MNIANLTGILKVLAKVQPEIMLVYRPTEKNSWVDRCFYLGEGYVEGKKYNHRSILKNEVVVEFDEKQLKKNKAYANTVKNRLKKDGIKSVSWYSGNKSVHLHFFIEVGDVSNLQLLKKTVMKYYCKNLIKPDLRLASDNHLIRAEYGVHERTGRYKKPIKWSSGFPIIYKLKQEIWDEYFIQYNIVLKRKTTVDVKDLETHPGMKLVLSSETFRRFEDGRERALFMLIHVLKQKYKDDKQGLITFLQDWYRYSGGTQMSRHQIRCKVVYHWDKTYNFGVTYLTELLESVGATREEIRGIQNV